GELAQAVREGRRNEFKDFALFSNAQVRDQIPDPNAPATYEQSRPEAESAWTTEQQEWRSFYQQLLQLRHTHIMPRLAQVQSLGATMLAERAVSAQWQLADKS